MEKLKIYLDTSVISFLFADDAPDFKSITVDFFDQHFEKYDVFISEIVMLEINNTVDPGERQKLLSVFERYPFKIIDFKENEKVYQLAELYVQEKAIPVNKKEDALHVAISTLYDMDILLSWNFRHLANIRKQIVINSINEREGYLKKLNLLSPLEVVYEE